MATSKTTTKYVTLTPTGSVGSTGNTIPASAAALGVKQVVAVPNVPTQGINAYDTPGSVVQAYETKNTQAAAPQQTAAPAQQSSGSGSGGGSGGGSTASAARTGADMPMYAAYDPAKDAAYQSALAALRQAQSNMPSYAGTYEGQLYDLYDQIANREKFSYDLNTDPLYGQYRESAVRQGQAAMQDTMGQAAALTGGYSSTYAQSAGQQALDSYLQSLNEAVPELYGAARDTYNAEGDRLLQQYSLMDDLRENEYGQYQDALNNWRTNLGLAMENEQLAYNRGLSAAQSANEARQNNYANLMEMIQIGYQPSDAELAAAGMSRDQLSAMKTYMAAQAAAASSGGGGGGSSSSGSSGKTKFTEDQVAEAGKTYRTYGETALYTYLDGLSMQGYSDDALETLGNYALSNFQYNPDSKTTQKMQAVEAKKLKK